jgi:hypothetical protein
MASENPESMIVPFQRLDVASGGEGSVDDFANFVYRQLPLELAGPLVEALSQIGGNVTRFRAAAHIASVHADPVAMKACWGFTMSSW